MYSPDTQGSPQQALIQLKKILEQDKSQFVFGPTLSNVFNGIKDYAREYNVNRFAANLFLNGEKDPGIPIDCEKGRSDSLGALRDWSNLGGATSRKNLSKIQVLDFQCDGYEIGIHSSARVTLPFVLPFIGVETVDISSRVGIFAERKITTNYYGLNLG